jgi:hypothetical protein
MEDITLTILDAWVVLSLDGVLGSPIAYSKLIWKHSATDTTSTCKRQYVMIIPKLRITFVSIMRR